MRIGLGRSWIIPARAGFTIYGGDTWRNFGDHPRSRGVYCDPVARESPDEGSSPLARGLRTHVWAWCLKERIIPAHAGFTVIVSYPRFLAGDHPRSRGVYLQERTASCLDPGSSPLARGLLSWPRDKSAEDRIIPARAGFTGASRARRYRLRDHPRSRGVYDRDFKAAGDVLGSSPLARGLQTRIDNEGVLARIIPARAGFTG